MLRIKEFARKCGCSVYTLRYYDETGILKPMYVDNDSGYRFYDDSQVIDYEEIKEFQEIGFSIQDIKYLENMSNDEIVKLIFTKIADFKELLDKAYVLQEKYIEGKIKNGRIKESIKGD